MRRKFHEYLYPGSGEGLLSLAPSLLGAQESVKLPEAVSTRGQNFRCAQSHADALDLGDAALAGELATDDAPGQLNWFAALSLGKCSVSQ